VRRRAGVSVQHDAKSAGLDGDSTGLQTAIAEQANVGAFVPALAQAIYPQEVNVFD
jgi:hypothetical protein